MDRENPRRPPSFLRGSLFWASVPALHREHCIGLTYRSSCYFSAFYSNLLRQYPLYANVGGVADGHPLITGQPPRELTFPARYTYRDDGERLG